MKSLLPLVSLAFVGFWPYSNAVLAEPVKYEITATVMDIAGPLQGGPVALGDSVTGHFFVESVASFISADADVAYYLTSDLVLNIGSNYQATGSAGSIWVRDFLDGGAPDDVILHFSGGTGLFGPAINTSWVPDYFHGKVVLPHNGIELPPVLTNQGTGGRLQLRYNVDDTVQISFTLEAIAVASEEPEPLTNVYYDVAGVDDINGNGYPEIAYLRTVSSGNVHVLLRDAISRDYIKTMTFLNADYEPLGITALPDVNGNGSNEIAVMALNTQTGDTRTRIRDALTGEILNEFNFSP